MRSDVEAYLHEMFPNWNFDEAMNPVIDIAVDDIIECSGWEEDGIYSGGDVSLACQRAILVKLGCEI